MSEDPIRTNVETLRRFIDAINGWDFEEMRRLVALDFVFEMPYAPSGFVRRIEGRDAWLDFMRGMPDFIEPENLHDIRINAFDDDPTELVAEYRSATRLRGTGMEYQNSYVVRAAVRGGQLQRFAEFYDPIGLVVAMGGRVEVPSAEDGGATDATPAREA